MERKKLLVHRKGASRSFPKLHPDLPPLYSQIGQPVFIGGSMGTCSYILVGSEGSMRKSFGTTCHGAGRAKSRNEMRRKFKDYEAIKRDLNAKSIVLRASDDTRIPEEAPEAYKNVDAVVETCEQADLSKRVMKVVPVCVIKG